MQTDASEGGSEGDIRGAHEGTGSHWTTLSGWFMKAADYGTKTDADSRRWCRQTRSAKAEQVRTLWPLIFDTGHEITFAHTSFKWANLAAHNAGVTVMIVGMSNDVGGKRRLYSESDNGEAVVKRCGQHQSLPRPRAESLRPASPVEPLTHCRGDEFRQHAQRWRSPPAQCGGCDGCRRESCC